MDIKILLSFGQGYDVCLTTKDARKLWEELNNLFLAPVAPSIDPGFFKPLGPNGYEAPVTVEDQASPTEAPGTLRENGCRSKDCNCNEWTTSPEVPNYGS